MKTLSRTLPFAVSLTVAGCTGADPSSVVASDDDPPAVDVAREALGAAQRAYVKRDHRAMVTELRRATTSKAADDAVRASALEVVDRALADAHGKLDGVFEVPEGMTWMRLLFQRGTHDGGAATHIAILNGGLVGDAAIADVTIVRERDGAVLASRSQKIGYFEAGGAGKDKYFYIHTSDAPAPMERGAYVIQWKLADGRSGERPVFVPSLALEGAPHVLSPARGERVEADRPTLRWEAPQWIGDATYGDVFFEASLTSPQAPGAPHKIWWSTWERQPKKVEATVEQALPDGDAYTTAVSYQRRIRYGALQLGASERTSTGFGVHAR